MRRYINNDKIIIKKLDKYNLIAVAYSMELGHEIKYNISVRQLKRLKVGNSYNVYTELITSQDNKAIEINIIKIIGRY